MLKKLLNNYLKQPAPKYPQVELLKVIGYGFLFGLFTIPFASSFSISQEPPHIMDLPLRVVASVALTGYYVTGISLLGPVGKKRAIILTIVQLAVLAFTMYRLLDSMTKLLEFKSGPDEMDWVTKESNIMIYGCLLVMFVTSGIGWVKWLRNKSPNDDTQVR